MECVLYGKYNIDISKNRCVWVCLGKWLSDGYMASNCKRDLTVALFSGPLSVVHYSGETTWGMSCNWLNRAAVCFWTMWCSSGTASCWDPLAGCCSPLPGPRCARQGSMGHDPGTWRPGTGGQRQIGNYEQWRYYRIKSVLGLVAREKEGKREGGREGEREGEQTTCD